MSKDINTLKGHIDKYLKNRMEDYTPDFIPPHLLDCSNCVEEEDQGKSK